MTSANDGCCGGGVCGTPRPEQGVERREFLRLAGWTGVALAGSTARAVAGPFEAQDFEDLVPADKKLTAAWLAALRERGTPTVLRGDELRHVGLPVGGICCGQLYIGGDGRLWLWDVFSSNQSSDYGGASQGPHYAQPRDAVSPVEQGFAIHVQRDGEPTRPLSSEGFETIEFQGEYPIAQVRYRDASCPVEVDLEAFSPFVPLEPELSALPATVLNVTVRNTLEEEVEVWVAGRLQNAVCPGLEAGFRAERVNRIRRRAGRKTLHCTVEPLPEEPLPERTPIRFADFEDEDYGGWVAEGTAFGDAPRRAAELAEHQGDVGAAGEGSVNSHETRGGEDVRGGDAHTGTLTSPPFRIQRRYVAFRIGGGRHPGETCLELLVDGAVVRSATGHDANRMRADAFDVSELEGREARLRIADRVSGPWGNIGVDEIVFTDVRAAAGPLEEQPGYGSMALTLVGDGEFDSGGARIPAGRNAPEASASLDEVLVGGLSRRLRLAAGEARTVPFLVTWWFPYHAEPRGEWAPIRGFDGGIGTLHRHYENQFSSASEVAGTLTRHLDRLTDATRAWRDTWYGGTLPHWFLERTFVTLDCLATQTCHWFDDGRFWGWEGVDCCPGTCQHVWNYAQGLARVFPSLEQRTRERIDFGLAWHEDGAVDYRAENAEHVAHDGLAGTIVRVWREHTMSSDDAFLRRVWPRVRRSIEYLMAEDTDGDGLLEGRQYNTLDAAWYGPMGWISSMYLAAVQAGRAMAEEMGDAEFAERCADIVARGGESLVARVFDGEYFIHVADPAHPEAIQSNRGCHIDQVLGQSLAWQVGLDRVVPRAETLSALRSLWRYNFTPDVGPYRAATDGVVKGGRWYAMPGEAGLLMTTFPKGGWREAPGTGPEWAVGYFNECMTGFEYQVAAHMIWEGLVDEGLAITRAIHERYDAARRNPFNEIECSDHYSRAMMSYGVYLAACGYSYHGPRGQLGFAPRVSPEHFRCAFTAAKGWGSFAQDWHADSVHVELSLGHGTLRLNELRLELPAGRRATAIRARGGPAPSLRQEGRGATLAWDETLRLEAGDTLSLNLLT